MHHFVSYYSLFVRRLCLAQRVYCDDCRLRQYENYLVAPLLLLCQVIVVSDGAVRSVTSRHCSHCDVTTQSHFL